MMGQGAATVTQHLLDEVCGLLFVLCVRIYEAVKKNRISQLFFSSLVQVQDAAQVFSPS